MSNRLGRQLPIYEWAMSDLAQIYGHVLGLGLGLGLDCGCGCGCRSGWGFASWGYSRRFIWQHSHCGLRRTLCLSNKEWQKQTLHKCPGTMGKRNFLQGVFLRFSLFLRLADSEFPFFLQFLTFLAIFFLATFFRHFLPNKRNRFCCAFCVLVFPLSILFFILYHFCCCCCCSILHSFCGFSTVFFFFCRFFAVELISRAPFNLSWWQHRLSLAATSWQPGQSTINEWTA